MVSKPGAFSGQVGDLQNWGTTLTTACVDTMKPSSSKHRTEMAKDKLLITANLTTEDKYFFITHFLAK